MIKTVFVSVSVARKNSSLFTWPQDEEGVYRSLPYELAAGIVKTVVAHAKKANSLTEEHRNALFLPKPLLGFAQMPS